MVAVPKAYQERSELEESKPGKRAEFLRIFLSQSIPAHAEIGMKIPTPFFSCADFPILSPVSR